MEEPWLRACKRLPVGGSARFRCCGKTPAGVIFNKSESYELYCHRCKNTAYHRKEFVSLREPEVQRPCFSVPADKICISQVSAETQSHVYQFIVSKGLMPDMLPEETSWSHELKRILFRVHSDTWIGRSTSPWIQPKWLMLGQPLQYAPAAPADLSQVSSIALTEDYLSALKLSYVSTHWAGSAVLPIALLGTRLSPALKAQLVSMNLPVCLMLDSDVAGRAGTAAVRRSLKPFMPLREHYFGVDPKEAPVKDILEAFNWTP